MPVRNRGSLIGSASGLQGGAGSPPVNVAIYVQYTDWNGDDHVVIDAITAGANVNATVNNSSKGFFSGSFLVQFVWTKENDFVQVSDFYRGDIEITTQEFVEENRFGNELIIPGRNLVSEVLQPIGELDRSDNTQSPGISEHLNPADGRGTVFNMNIKPPDNSAGSIIITVGAGSAYATEDMNSFGPVSPVVFQIDYNSLPRETDQPKPEVRIVVPRNLSDFVDAEPTDFEHGKNPVIDIVPPEDHPEAGEDFSLEATNELHYQSNIGLWTKNEGGPTPYQLQYYIEDIFSSDYARWLGRRPVGGTDQNKTILGEEHSYTPNPDGPITDWYNSDEEAQTWLDNYANPTDMMRPNDLIYFWEQDNVIRKLRTEFGENSGDVTFVWSTPVTGFTHTDTDIHIAAVNHEGTPINHLGVTIANTESAINGASRGFIASFGAVGTSQTKYKATLNIPPGTRGTITITVRRDALGENMGPPDDTIASFDFVRGQGGITPGGTLPSPGTKQDGTPFVINTICSGTLPNFTDFIDSTNIRGAYKGSIDTVVIGNKLYTLLQVQIRGDGPNDELSDVDDARVILIEVDVTPPHDPNNCTPNVLRTYPSVLQAPKRLIDHDNKLFFFEGHHLIYEHHPGTNTAASVDNADWRNETGDLKYVDPDGTEPADERVKPAGRAWRYRLNHPTNTESLYENRVYGILAGASAPIVSDGENIHIMASFGRYNQYPSSVVKTDRHQGYPITHIDAVQWLVYGKDLNRRVEKLETNDRSGWDVLLELANITASYIGFDNGEFFYRPRYPIKAKLNEDINNTTTTIALKENNRYFPVYGYILINGEIIEYNANSVVASDVRDATPIMYAEGTPTLAGNGNLGVNSDDLTLHINDSGTVREITALSEFFADSQSRWLGGGTYAVPGTSNINTDQLAEEWIRKNHEQDISYFWYNGTELKKYHNLTLTNVQRGAKESTEKTHTADTDVYYVNHIIDTRNIEIPIEDIDLEQDTQQLFNQIRIMYGGDLGLVHPEDDEESIRNNRGIKFELEVPLNRHQNEWVEWLAKLYLETYKDIRYITDVDLKLSFYIKVGDTLMIRDYSPNAEIYNDLVFEVLEVNHSKSEQTTSIKIRTIN